MSEEHERNERYPLKSNTEYIFWNFTCPHFRLEFLDAVDDTEPPSDLVAEQSLAELEHGPHGEGEVDQVDVLVPHGQVLLADGEHPGALGRGPDAQVGQGQPRAVKHVAEAPDLVLLVM